MSKCGPRTNDTTHGWHLLIELLVVRNRHPAHIYYSSVGFHIEELHTKHWKLLTTNLADRQQCDWTQVGRNTLCEETYSPFVTPDYETWEKTYVWRTLSRSGNQRSYTAIIYYIKSRSFAVENWRPTLGETPGRHFCQTAHSKILLVYFWNHRGRLHGLTRIIKI